MPNIDTKVEVWKKRLLDLGRRNRLINYRETKRSSLKITTPDCFSLWQFFVQDEKPLEFPYYDELTDEENASSLFSVVTSQTVKDMQKTLRVLRNRAKTAYEEQGVNILYLSFGFLKWTESIDSEVWNLSPLVLVPVTLTVESISDPFVLNLHEDEIVVNPTLLYKLENDFGLSLPDLGDDEDIKILFHEVQKLVSRNRWEVIAETGLSLLSFLKINMYNDISRNKDAIVSNPLIRTISGDATTSNKIPDDLPDYDFDNKLKPTETFQVVDADSSQQDAILCAKRGLSFVLQGPPGTGKSQTITNIIAECLADGKKVLFVSEKMAALDVVHRRLTNAGLDDFCLILHSFKANKRAILDQLGITLSLATKKAQLSDDAYYKLDTLHAHRQKLNDYAKQVFCIVEPFGKSIYEVNGILANLESYEDIEFDIFTTGAHNDVSAVTGKKYNHFIYLLSQFCETVGKMSDDYKNNPWYGSNVAAVTNELRHDIGAKLGRLIPRLSTATNDVSAKLSDLSLKLDITYDVLVDILPVLNIAKQAKPVPVSWILGGDISSLSDEINQCDNLQTEFFTKQAELTAQEQNAQQYNNSLLFTPVNSLLSSECLTEETIKLEDVLSTTMPYTKWHNRINEAYSIFEEAKKRAIQINLLVSELLAIYENGIFDIPYNDIFARYKTEYTSLTKYFKSSYKEDKKVLQAQFKVITKKVTDMMILDTIGKLREIDNLRRWFADNKGCLQDFFDNTIEDETSDYSLTESLLYSYRMIMQCKKILGDMLTISREIDRIEEAYIKSHFQFLYNRLETDWIQIKDKWMWATSFKEEVKKNKCDDDFIKLICSEQETADKCNATIQLITRTIDDVTEDLVWYLSLFVEPNQIRKLSFPVLQDKMSACINGLFHLEEWIDFRTIREQCSEEGLSDYIKKIEDLHISIDRVIPIFKKRFLRLWLDAVLPNYPAVMNFRRRVQESTVNEFTKLDKLQFEIAKARIRSKLINDLPTLERFTSGVDEISILKRELNKQRRIMPIRRLFREIPNLLLTLKPCLMMSPLSVSLFLEAETYKFDTVIFDEASQVCTENAIGAISRGKQVIIAGDSKQLPPTNFFLASISSDTDYDTLDDDDEYDDTDAFESVLDEASLLPERTLLWHYRSRHEHLIAFSNAKIYRNNLITFPSNVSNGKDCGVEYIYVKDGFYDRGGRKGNIIEAKKVADIVFEHIKNYPNRSLGVIAFGEVQQLAIETAIHEKLLRNQQYESFFNEETNEPFFVKSLEHVQGDERDTIIFSIGYAKDASGVFRMNFGPLSRSGGERRLNVAITRAKHNVKLVGSIKPTDIDTDRVSSEGPKLLRAYIDFAMNGDEVLNREITESDIAEHDSPFEKAVYDFLDRKGFKLATQVGCSGYRIDIAVKHPTISGKYVLGIECDGASYHSARTARERDRLRQEVLENMGWSIYRIWSTDWIKDSITEGNKLINAIEAALDGFDADEDSDNDDLYIEPGFEDFVSVEEKVVSNVESSNPYGFASAVKTNFSALPRNSMGQLSFADCIVYLVNNQYPLHYELMCQQLAPLFGNKKATVKVRRSVDFRLNYITDRVTRKGDFLFPATNSSIIVRMPNTRKIGHISIEELAEAMLKIISFCVGTTKEKICVETARVYGFSRSSQEITASMNAACDLLLEQGRVKETGGKLSVVEADGSATIGTKRVCVKCGASFDTGDAFCGKCGSKI